MQEKIKALPQKLLMLWNKYTSKQKTIIIGVLAGVIVLFAVLIWLLGRMHPVELHTFGSTKSASQAISVLEASGIEARLKSDNLTVEVDEKKYSQAIMVISTSDAISDTGFGIDDLLATSLSTTNGERLLRNNLYAKSELTNAINSTIGVDSSIITYIPKDTSTSILSSTKNTPCAITLQTNSKFNKKTAETIAKLVAATLGNDGTDEIKIMDQYGELLYDGPQDEKQYTSVSDKEAYTAAIKKSYETSIVACMLKNGFTDCVVVLENLKINYDKVTETIEKYTPADDQEQGLMLEYHSVKSSGTSGNGDVVGTDGNDQNDYYMPGTSGSDSSYKSEDIYYQPNYTIKSTIYDSGVVNPETSSLGITVTKTIDRTEEELRILGELEGTTYEEYKLNNSELVRLKVNDELYDLVSMATGIPVDNITITAYRVYNFIPTVPQEINWSLYLEIFLAVLIVALLIYVVFRGMRAEEVVELEPELSVEQLLATTKENQSLEDVEFSEKSEIRKLIEKFFDENPEAVAQLLRNWLNEDWE